MLETLSRPKAAMKSLVVRMIRLTTKYVILLVREILITIHIWPKLHGKNKRREEMHCNFLNPIFYIGLWTDWSIWSDSPCSSTCGGGYHTRSRECKQADDPTVDLPSGCAGDSVEVQDCINTALPDCPG